MMMAARRPAVFVAISAVMSAILFSNQKSLGAAGAGPAKSPLSYRVVEECTSGTFIADLKNDAVLMTSRPSDQLEFRLLTNITFLELDPSSGILRTSGRIDRDIMCPSREECTQLAYFTVKPLSDLFKVIIEVEDINDNSPKFPNKFVSNRIPESSVPGQLSLFVDTAFDPDSPPNGISEYHLEQTDDERRHQPFHLVKRRGPSGDFDLRLELNQAVDRERKDFYQVKVIATDGGDVRRSGSVVIEIIVDDVNDNSPRFVNATYSVEVTENAPPDRQLIVVRATDADLGLNGKVTYSLSDVTRQRYGGLFAVDADTGVVSQRSPIDFEEYGDEIVLEVVARDVAGLDGASSMSQATALITVNVRDVNDNDPTIRIEIETDSGDDGVGQVEGGSVVLKVDEHVLVNRVLAVVSVDDRDSGNAGRVHCSMPSTQFELKQIYEKEFQVSTGPGVIDRELQDSHRLVIKCNDMGHPIRSSSATIDVIVNDINDNDPLFSETVYSWTMVENQPIGTVVGRVTATDQDTGANGHVTYRLQAEESDRPIDLSINATTGIVSTRLTFDREVSPAVRVLVLAIDNGSVIKTASATVDIKITDVDDETAEFTKEWFVFQVDENSPANTEVGRPTAEDRDSNSSFNKMSFYLDTSSANDVLDDIGRLFRVDPETGVIYTRQPLDRETRSVYNITVAVASMTSSTSSSPRSTNLCHVIIYVSDVNDCPPVFAYPSAAGNDTIRVSGRSAEGQGGHLVVVVATDGDAGDNAKLSYDIAGWRRRYSSSETSAEEEQALQPWRYANNQFFIHSVTGKVYVSQFDSLEGTATELLITVEDGGNPSLTSSAVLTIIVDKVGHRSRASNYFDSFLAQPLGGVSLAVLVAGFAGLLVLIALMAMATVVARRNRKHARDKHNHASLPFDDQVSNSGYAGAESLWSQQAQMSPTESNTSSLQRCAILDVSDALTDSDEVTNGEQLTMDADENYVRSRSGTLTSYEDAVRRAAHQMQVYSSRDQLNMIGVANTRVNNSYSPNLLMTSQPSPKFSTFANWPTPSPTHSNAAAGSRFGTLERRTVRFKDNLASESPDPTEAMTADKTGGGSFLGVLPPPPPPLAIDSFGDISYTSPFRLQPFPCSSHV